MTMKKDAKPAAKPAAVKAEPTRDDPKVEAQKPAEPAPEQPRSNKPKTLREPADTAELTVSARRVIELANHTSKTIVVDELLGNKLIAQHEVLGGQMLLVEDRGNHFRAFFA